MDFTDPWHLTVVRTRGLLFVRPEKSWRPIVSISVVDNDHDHGLPHEVRLGCDGQNPNLKSAIPVHEVKATTKLVIQVFHKSQTKKKHRKRNLVGSASLSFTEFLNKHPLPHPSPVDYDVRLSCPPPQRKCATIGGKQQHSATLTMRFTLTTREPAPSQPESPPTSPISERDETEPLLSDAPSSSRAQSETLVTNTPDERGGEAAPWGKQPERDRLLDGTAGLRRRRRRRSKRPRVRGFDVDSDEPAAEASSSEESYFPETPEDEHFPPIYEDEPRWKFGAGVDGCEEGDGEVVFSPSVLPVHAEQVDVVGVRASVSFAEGCLYWISPYEELREAAEGEDCEMAEKVLARLLTEWYVVGASLLALAGIDAAVFGFAPGGLFVLEGFSLGAVSIGAIAAGLGLVYDAWFLVLYSGANGTKFLRLAKDVYNSYIFFSLTCRLPILCMALSTVSLMAFLLAVAWTAWPTAVLVMSFVAGFLLTSQFVVFGIHRLINFVIWAVRVAWRAVMRRKSPPCPEARLRPQGPGLREPRIEMPVPCVSRVPVGPVVATLGYLTADPKTEVAQWAEDCARECEVAVPS
ncbi:hypothetical protein LXA43DRAFT_370993 [Ganoderma leucocontextum]|nr:hypothetical protein LXA43DRAFT_370993 [Ganoderma leucocontextum]